MQYCLKYTVRIRLTEVGVLWAAVESNGLEGFFSIRDAMADETAGVLTCEAEGTVAYRVADAIGEFTKGPVSAAAAESITIKILSDGELVPFCSIGPINEIRKIGRDLADDDIAAAISGLEDIQFVRRGIREYEAANS